MDHHHHQSLYSRYAPLRPPPPPLAPPPPHPFSDDSATFYHPSNPHPPLRILLSPPHPPRLSFHHHRQHHNYPPPDHPSIVNLHHLHRLNEIPIPRQPHNQLIPRHPQNQYLLDCHHHHHHHDHHRLPQSPRSLYERDRLRLPIRSPPHLEPSPHKNHHPFPINETNHLWEPPQPRRPPSLPSPQTIQEIELDPENHSRGVIAMELMSPSHRGGPVEGFHVDLMSPHHGGSSSSPLVWIDRIRRDSDVRVPSRFRGEPGDVDGFVYGDKRRESSHQLSNFIMDDDLREKGFDHGEGYMSRTQFRLRDVEMSLGGGDILHEEMMMPDERLVGTSWGDFGGEDRRHNWQMRDGVCSPIRLRAIEHERDRNGFAGSNERGKKVLLESMRGIDWDRRDKEEQFNCMPRKKPLPKKSAFLRMQPLKHSYRNIIPEKSSIGQEKTMDKFTDQRIKEEREGSPVEMDVSFKSNALVAKAVKAPLAALVVCKEDSSPKDVKLKNMTSEVSGSVSQPDVIPESSSRVDNGRHFGSESFISVKKEKRSEEEVRGSTSFKKMTPVSDSSASSTPKSLSVKSSAGVSPQGDSSDKKESAANLFRTSAANVRKKRRITCPANSGPKKKDVDSVNADTLVNTSPTVHLSNNFGELHQGLTSCDKVNVPSDIGLVVFPTKGDEVADGSSSIEASLSNNKRKQNMDLYRDLGPINNEDPADSGESFDSKQPTLNSIGSVTRSPDKSSSILGVKDGNRNNKSLVPPLVDNGCPDLSSDHVFPPMVSFGDGCLASCGSLNQCTQFADSSIPETNNFADNEIKEKISFRDIDAITVSSDCCEKQPTIPEITISEVACDDKYDVRDRARANSSKCNDFIICESQSNAEDLSFRAGLAFCSDDTITNSKELTTDLSSLETIEKQAIAGAFAVASDHVAAAGFLKASVYAEGDVVLFSDNGSSNLKKIKLEDDLGSFSSRTADVDSGAIPVGTVFSCPVRAEHSTEERIAVSEHGCSNVGSQPCKDESYILDGCSMIDSFLVGFSVSGTLNTDPTIVFPSFKRQKILPESLAFPDEPSRELYETVASSELRVVDAPMLSHPLRDSLLLVEREQASGTDSGLECLLAGSTWLPEKSLACVTDDYDVKVSQCAPLSTDSCPFVKQSDLLDDQSPCFSESGHHGEQDKCYLMDAVNYDQKLVASDILQATPGEKALDNSAMKDKNGRTLDLKTKDIEYGHSDKDAEGDNSLPCKDELPSINCKLLFHEPTDRDATWTSCTVDSESNIANKEYSSTLKPKLSTSIVAIDLNDMADRNLFVSDRKSHMNSLNGGSPPMWISSASTGQSKQDLNSCCVYGGEHHDGKTRSVPLQATRRMQPASIAMRGELSKGKHLFNYIGTEFFSGRQSIVAPSSKRTSKSHILKPRTWHRSDKLAASGPSLNDTLLSTIPPKMPPFKKSVDIRGNTYIRKGSNSIIRTPASASAEGTCVLSRFNGQNRPPAMCSARSTNVNMSELEFEDASNGLGTGGGNSPLEIPKTPPLPYSSNLSKDNAVALAECRTSPGANDPVAAEEEVVKSSFEALKSPNSDSEPDKNMEDQSVQTDGFSCNKNKMVYIKSKLNQLVAASTAVNFVDVHQSSSSNRYFKRNKNQLVRASSKIQMQKRVIKCNDDSYSRGEKVIEKHSGGTSLDGLACKGAPKSSKHQKHSLVWTLHKTPSSTNKVHNLLHCQKMLPNLLPWKRPTYWRSFLLSATRSNSNSISMLRRKFLSSRKRDIIYTRSGLGFTLQRSKVVSVGGRSLKWSKSIERRSKKANKEATLAVAEMEIRTREKHNVIVVSGAKRRNSSRDRIFRIGTFRYKMDPSGRTLQRISDEEPSSSDAGKPENHVRKPYVPKRLLIGSDEYVQVGNGNQLIRDPKRRKRILANEKVRWSLHTARMKLAKKWKYCLFFTRFGKCNKEEGKCPYIHDSSKIAVCTRFLNGICSDLNCKLTHKVIPERMPDCSFFLQDMCSSDSCPYRHVNVNPKAGICGNFLRGYCAGGNECQKKHSYICPIFEATGSCPEEPKCRLYHPRKGKVKRKRSSEDQKNSLGRYFDAGCANITEPDTIFISRKLIVSKSDDDEFLGGGRYADYISLDVSEDEGGEDDVSVEPPSLNLSDCSCTLLEDHDELIKPVRLLGKNDPNDLHPATTTLRPDPSYMENL